MSAAVGAAQPYQLGGASGLTRGWGLCLGAEVAGDLVIYRSRWVVCVRGLGVWGGRGVAGC